MVANKGSKLGTIGDARCPFVWARPAYGVSEDAAPLRPRRIREVLEGRLCRDGFTTHLIALVTLWLR